jgi:hypothetical protein
METKIASYPTRYNLRREVSGMKTRSVTAALGLLLAVLPMRIAAKEATVTLEVTGMS